MIGAPCQKYAHYLPAYRNEFSLPVVTSVLEIGVAAGGSLRYWAKLFPDARVVGIDIDPRCKKHERDHIHVRIGSQGNVEFLRKVAAEFGPFDIILDDGSHKFKDQKASFVYLWQHLRKPGCYCVEDLHANYWFGCNPCSAMFGGFVAYASRIAHVLNANWYSKRHPIRQLIGHMPVSVDDVAKVVFYDSMVFIHKADHPDIYIATP